MTKYIGDREIEKVEGSIATFKPVEGKPDTEEYSEKMLERIITDEPIDLTSLRDKRCFQVAEDIINVLLEHNVYLTELEYILQKVGLSFQINRNHVEDKLWGCDEQKKTIKQLDEYIKKLCK